MPDLFLRNLTTIKRRDPELGEALEQIQTSHNYVAQQVNASPVGVTPPPLAPASITATGGAGIVHVTVGDPNQMYRGNEYHMEVMPHDGNWATDAHPISTGPARAYRGNLGVGKYVVRACTGYGTSAASPWIYSGVVDATGTSAPVFHKSTGSGTGGGGYGSLPFTGNTPPKRQ